MSNVFEFPKDNIPALESTFPEVGGIVVHAAFSKTPESPINDALARARALADLMEATDLSADDAILLLPDEPSSTDGGVA